MKQDLSNKRKVYNQNFIDFNKIEPNPMEQFRLWFQQADECDEIEEANAMTISTINSEGFPRNRVVLLKEFNSEGFVFYTNYNSEKGKALLDNPKTCISFFWPALQQQVIIKGSAETVNGLTSDEYFATRPRESQLGAWVSPQSNEIDFEDDFQQQIEFYATKFADVEVSRPPHWGGFLIRPFEIEFWQGRPSRLHDRLVYKLVDGNWRHVRLAP